MATIRKVKKAPSRDAYTKLGAQYEDVCDRLDAALRENAVLNRIVNETRTSLSLRPALLAAWDNCDQLRHEMRMHRAHMRTAILQRDDSAEMLREYMKSANEKAWALAKV